MTEQEWLTSSDPLRMLGMHAGPGYRTWLRPVHLNGVSDRKLRLFACAVSRAHPKSDIALSWGADHAAKALLACGVAERLADGELTQEEAKRLEPHCWTVMSSFASEAARLMADEPRRTPLTASILRDMVNPFRPVTLPKGPAVYEWVKCDNPRCEGGKELNCYTGVRVPCPVCYGAKGLKKERPDPCPWLTDDVVRIATLAYEERGRKVCGECDKGWLPKVGTPDAGMMSRCSHCKGTGHIDDGTLDEARLAVLSDALEEAGCATSEPCEFCKGKGFHETGFVKCDGDGIHDSREKIGCVACKTSGRKAHPVVAHLRSPGPHYRGCWAVDLIRGYL